MPDCLGDVFDVARLQMWSYRKRNRMVADPGGLYEVLRLVSVFGQIVGHPRHGLRVVDTGSNSGRFQARHQFPALPPERFIQNQAEALVAVGDGGARVIEHAETTDTLQ